MNGKIEGRPSARLLSSKSQSLGMRQSANIQSRGQKQHSHFCWGNVPRKGLILSLLRSSPPPRNIIGLLLIPEFNNQ